MTSNNIKLILLLNILLLTYIYCNNDDTITTPFKIGKNEYMLTYPNSEEGVELFTVKFCSEKGHEFGITNDSINDLCINPISKYLIKTLTKNKNNNIDISNDGNIKDIRPSPIISQEMLDKYQVTNIENKDRVLHLEFTINNKIYELIIGPQDEYFDAARSFCYKNQKDFDIVIPHLSLQIYTKDDDVTTCIAPIEKQIINSMAKHKWTDVGYSEPEEESEMDKNYKVINIQDIGKKLSLDLLIYNVDFNLLIASHESYFSVAKKFCITNKNKLEFSSDELKDCINIIEMQIGKAVVKHKYLGNTKAKQHSHENYIHKETESLEKTEEYLKKKYEGNTKEKQQSHSNFISKESREEKKKIKELRRKKILNENEKLSNDKESSISAKFDIGGIQYDITFNPTTDTIPFTAEKFCRQHFGDFELTEDTITVNCINPISDNLRVAVKQEMKKNKL